MGRCKRTRRRTSKESRQKKVKPLKVRILVGSRRDKHGRAYHPQYRYPRERKMSTITTKRATRWASALPVATCVRGFTSASALSTSSSVKDGIQYRLDTIFARL